MERQAALAEAYRRDILPPEQKAAYEEAMNRGLVGSVKNSFSSPQTLKDKAISYISGADRREFDFPEIGSSPEYGRVFHEGKFNSAGLKASAGMLSSTRPEQEVDILRNHFPEAQIEQDSHGHHMVSFPSGKYYLNRPGLSPRDITKPVFQGAAYLAATQGAGKLVPAQSLLGQSAVVGGAAGATSLGFDAGASAAGSEQGLNVPQAGVNAVLGGLFEVARPLITPIWRALTAKGTVPDVPQARAALVDAGFNPEELTDEAVDYFIKQANTSISPRAAATVAEANTLPVKVPLKQGQITGSSRQQMTEDLMEKGAFGDAAENIMKGRTSQTQEAIRENIPAIQQRLGGGQVVQRGEGAAAAQRALVAKNDRLSQAISEAYEAARATKGATIPGHTAGSLYDDVAASADDFIPHTKVAQKELAKLKGIIQGNARKSTILDANGAPIEAVPHQTAADIKKLYDWRRRVSSLARNTSDRTESKALAEMRKQFDRNMKTVLDGDLMQGNAKAIKAWRKAIRMRAVRGNMFESGDLVSSLVETEYKGGGLRLKVAPEAAGNYILGKSDLGIISRPEMTRELYKLRKVLGPKSPEWNAIREEVFLRIAAAGEGGYVSGARQFSGAKLLKAWSELTRKNHEVMRVLFSTEESKLIAQFARVAARATNPAKGGANNSNTGPALANTLQRVSGFLAFGEKGRALLSRIFPAGYDAIQAGQAYKTARGVLPKRQMPVGLSGGLGVAGMNAYPSSSSNQ